MDRDTKIRIALSHIKGVRQRQREMDRLLKDPENLRKSLARKMFLLNLSRRRTGMRSFR